jgi:hypothetical protein
MAPDGRAVLAQLGEQLIFMHVPADCQRLISGRNSPDLSLWDHGQAIDLAGVLLDQLTPPGRNSRQTPGPSFRWKIEIAGDAGA